MAPFPPAPRTCRLGSTAKKAQFPSVKNWQTLLDGLNYPDIPSAEAYMPNYNEAWARGTTFANLVMNTSGLDIDKEIADLRLRSHRDLRQVISS